MGMIMRMGTITMAMTIITAISMIIITTTLTTHTAVILRRARSARLEGWPHTNER
jgi:uncharacterized membrane protein YhaH (DUF805 family)